MQLSYSYFIIVEDSKIKIMTNPYTNPFDSYEEEEINRPDDMGLFTFYRQQQGGQEMRKLSSKAKVTPKRYRKTQRGKGQKVFGFSQRNEEQSAVKFKSIRCEEFLKNVGMKSWKYKPAYSISNTQSQTSKKDVIDQSRNEDKQMDYVKEEDRRVRQSTNHQKSRPAIKNVDQVIQVSPQRHTKPRFFPGKTTKYSFRLKSQEPQQRNFRYSKELVQIDGNKDKVNFKSLQRSFLQKIRKSDNGKEDKPRNRLKISSGTCDNFHTQNHKYLTNLIDKCYLPHGQFSQNQAAKMLKESLKFPNLLYTKTRIRTQGNQPEQNSPSVSPQQRYLVTTEITASFRSTRREERFMPRNQESREVLLFTQSQLSKMVKEQIKKGSPVRSIKNSTLRSILRP